MQAVLDREFRTMQVSCSDVVESEVVPSILLSVQGLVGGTGGQRFAFSMEQFGPS